MNRGGNRLKYEDKAVLQDHVFLSFDRMQYLYDRVFAY